MVNQSVNKYVPTVLQQFQMLKYNLFVFYVNEINLFFSDIISIIICFYSEHWEYVLHMETRGSAAVQGYEECYFCLEMWAGDFSGNVNDKQMVHFQTESKLALRKSVLL